MCSLQKIPSRLRGTNFCTTSANFAPSFVRQPNGHECTQIVQNTAKHQFRVKWGGLGSLRKIPTRLRGKNFCTSSSRFAPSFDRAGVPDLSVSGDKFDLEEDDTHDPTTTSEPEVPMQSLNQLHVVTDLVGARSA